MKVRIVIRWSPVRISGSTVLRTFEGLWCLLAGHKHEVIIGDRSLALHCQRCGRTSAGWQLGGSRPLPR